MKLIVGGLGQGMLAWALKEYGLTPADVARTAAEAASMPVLDGLEELLRDPDFDPDPILRRNPEIILVCRELGCGLEPLDRAQRDWRERVGRVCCDLALRADTVVRVCCGIGQVLK